MAVVDKETMLMDHLIEIEVDYIDRTMQKLDQCEKKFDIILKMLRKLNLNGSSESETITCAIQKGDENPAINESMKSQTIKSYNVGFLLVEMPQKISVTKIEDQGNCELLGEEEDSIDSEESDANSVFDQVPNVQLHDEILIVNEPQMEVLDCTRLMLDEMPKLEKRLSKLSNAESPVVFECLISKDEEHYVLEKNLHPILTEVGVLEWTDRWAVLILHGCSATGWFSYRGLAADAQPEWHMIFWLTGVGVQTSVF